MGERPVVFKKQKKTPRKPFPSSQECSIFLLSSLGASIQFHPSIHLKQVKTHWGDAGLNFATHLAQTVCCLQRIPQVSARNMELINSSRRNELQNDGWLASMRLNCLHLLCVLHVWNRWMRAIFTALPGLVIAPCILNVPAVHNLWCILEKERERENRFSELYPS